MFQTNETKKHAGITILISDKIDCNPKINRHDRKGQFIFIKGNK